MRAYQIVLLFRNRSVKITRRTGLIFFFVSSLNCATACRTRHNPACPASADSPMYSIEFFFRKNWTYVRPAYCAEKTVFFLHSTAHELPAIEFHGFANVKGILNNNRPLPDIFHIWPHFRSTIIEHIFHPCHIIRQPDTVVVDPPCYKTF